MSPRRGLIVATVLAGLALPSLGLGAITGKVFNDRNSNGIMDPGGFVPGGGLTAANDPEPGVQGVVVRAFTWARDAYGKALPVLTTNAEGRYQFNGLLPGSYEVKFIYPPRYTGTISSRGVARYDSNPKSTKLNRRVALTPTFTVYDKTQGTTVPQTNPKVNARYINPTIDAGLVVDTGGPQVVTG